MYFVGFYSVPNFIVILFNLLYLVFYVDFIVRVVYEREYEDLRQIEDQRSFHG